MMVQIFHIPCPDLLSHDLRSQLINIIKIDLWLISFGGALHCIVA